MYKCSSRTERNERSLFSHDIINNNECNPDLKHRPDRERERREPSADSLFSRSDGMSIEHNIKNCIRDSLLFFLGFFSLSFSP